MTPIEACSEFDIDTTNIVAVQPFGSGHIHDTYKVQVTKGNHYLLQRINHSIFTDVPLMQKNIENVINYLYRHNTFNERVLEMVPGKDGNSYFKDEIGDYWRMFVFISGSKTYDRIQSPAIAFEAGKAFGRFQYRLRNFNTSLLKEPLPRFHDIYYRQGLFEDAVLNDPEKRVIGISDEIDFVRFRKERMRQIFNLGTEGKIPLRVTHNDTKINNVLFDKYDKAICVIDLDTVMPGYIHYDFGDAIRTGAASADEDERSTDKMAINLNLFEAYSRGFLGQIQRMLNETEKQTLVFAPQLMTFIIGLRFLTDYINGDVYFKIRFDDHNLVRWRAQKKLLLSMEEKEKDMNEILKRNV